MKFNFLILFLLSGVANAGTVVPQLSFAVSLSEKARATLLQNNEKVTVALYYTADFKNGEDPQTAFDSQMAELAVGGEPVVFGAKDVTKALGKKAVFNGVFLNAYSNRATTPQNWLDCSAPSIDRKDLAASSRQLLGIHCSLIGE